MSEVKEVTAWAVVDKRNEYIEPIDTEVSETEVRASCVFWTDMHPSDGPYRVIRVRIVPDTEGKPTP